MTVNASNASYNMLMKVGDRITFRAVTRWSNGKAETRKVNGFTELGWPTVRFGGWGEFVVRPSEVVHVHKAEPTA